MTNISSKKSLADRVDEGTVKFGGISGSDSIPSSWAKSRYRIGAIKQATLLTANEGVTIVFSGPEGKPLYAGESHTLCDSLNKSRPQSLKIMKMPLLFEASRICRPRHHCFLIIII